MSKTLNEAESYGPSLSFSHIQTARTLFGGGIAAEVGLELKALGRTRAFLVVDPYLHKHTELSRIVERALGVRLCGVFERVVADASSDSIDAAAAEARALGADSLVSLGGGSAIDTAKGIGVVLALGGSIHDHQGTEFLGGLRFPHIAIPTTAGTGSEVSMYCVVRDSARGEKMHFVDQGLIPQVAVLDPLLTLGMPPQLTAATAFDALSHAIEAYTSQARNPISDAEALHAAHLIARYLPRVLHDGTDVVARGQMLLASNLAGAAMSNAGVGLAHAIAHVVGAKFHVHHGTANAIALGPVIRFNEAELGARYGEIAQAMGGRDTTQICASLIERSGLPRRFRDTGVPEQALENLAEAALADGAIVYNGRFAADRDLVLQILREAW